jgi:hypothetical protein
VRKSKTIIHNEVVEISDCDYISVIHLNNGTVRAVSPSLFTYDKSVFAASRDYCTFASHDYASRHLDKFMKLYEIGLIEL